MAEFGDNFCCLLLFFFPSLTCAESISLEKSCRGLGCLRFRSGSLGVRTSLRSNHVLHQVGHFEVQLFLKLVCSVLEED